MRAVKIIISVANNGYLVETENFGGIFKEHNNSWTFESMEHLQKRLPEILAGTHEQRAKQANKW